MTLTLEPTPALKTWHWAILVALLALCLGIRWHEAYRGSLQQDELWSMELAAGNGSAQVKIPRGVVIPQIPEMTRLATAKPWWTVPGSLDAIVHPPAYYTLLGVFRRIADGQMPARWLSAALGVLALGVYFDCVRRLVNVGAGLWTVAIVAVCRPGSETGVEVRPYALLLLAAALSLRGWIGVVQTGRRRWVALLFAAMLLLELTHYFGLGLGLAMGIMSLAILRGRARALAAGAILGATFVFAAVWGHMLYVQFFGGWFSAGDDANVFLIRDGPTLSRELEWLATLPARLIYVVKIDRASTAYWFALLAGVIWVLPWVMARKIPGAAVLGFCAVGGILAPGTLDLSRGTAHVEYLRYVILALPPVAAIVATIPSWLGMILEGNAARAVAVVPAVACFAAANSLPAEYGEKREDLTPFVTLVDKNVPPGALLIFTGEPDASLAYIPRTHVLLYAFYGKNQHPFVIAREPIPPATMAEIRRLTPPGGIVWTASEQGSPSPWRVLPGLRSVRGVGGAVGGAGQVAAFRFPEDLPATEPSP